METKISLLYYLTGSFLVLAILFITLVGWVSHRFSVQQKYMERINKHWEQEIECMKAILITEFQAILTELKKIIK